MVSAQPSGERQRRSRSPAVQTGACHPQVCGQQRAACDDGDDRGPGPAASGQAGLACLLEISSLVQLSWAAGCQLMGTLERVSWEVLGATGSHWRMSFG